MKKYLFLIAMALGVMVAATSCGGDKKTTEEAGSNETTEEVAVVETVAEPEDNTLKPPFTITAVQDGTFMNGLTKTTITLTFKSNGRVEGRGTEEWKYNNTDEWVPAPEGSKPEWEVNAKWTTRYREVGEGSQKVYEVGDEEYFVPEDGEYLYRFWDECEQCVIPDGEMVQLIYKITEKKNLK